MGASKGDAKPKVVIKDIDIEKLPMENIKNRELYLIELITKKQQITDKHVGEGIKPTKEDNMLMTRLNIEITEQMEKIFHSKKKRKKPKKKIILDPLLPVYKYSKLKKDFEILSWQWEELNGEYEEYNNIVKEKRKADILSKDRGLHRQDPFYPDEDESDEENDDEDGNNINTNKFFNAYNKNKEKNEGNKGGKKEEDEENIEGEEKIENEQKEENEEKKEDDEK